MRRFSGSRTITKLCPGKQWQAGGRVQLNQFICRTHSMNSGLVHLYMHVMVTCGRSSLKARPSSSRACTVTQPYMGVSGCVAHVRHESVAATQCNRALLNSTHTCAILSMMSMGSPLPLPPCPASEGWCGAAVRRGGLAGMAVGTLDMICQTTHARTHQLQCSTSCKYTLCLSMQHSNVLYVIHHTIPYHTQIVTLPGTGLVSRR